MKPSEMGQHLLSLGMSSEQALEHASNMRLLLPLKQGKFWKDVCYYLSYQPKVPIATLDYASIELRILAHEFGKIDAILGDSIVDIKTKESERFISHGTMTGRFSSKHSNISAEPK